ncbi:nuclear transport factor 2 family protein [Pseudozobellia thermophila]|uniref:DUF4440 domain-containing protein n=1 Tax=Pseudozobellia thermophila TaxID=192903 RepID=A0A1M6F2V6_9FLAO|nr:nuclear transport factor 2 family protein [Pseudozobellia thermophila]SHI92001.1 protein of unknown function [Pseudozobellia thermophila]
MKKTIYLYAFLGLFTACVQAQSNTDKKNIETGVGALYAAMVARDGAALQKLTDDKLTYGHSSGTLENKEEYIEAVLKGPFDFFSILPEDQTIAISGDVGIVRHIFVAKGTNDGKDADVRIGVMMTWQKKNNEWRLLARQAYKLM